MPFNFLENYLYALDKPITAIAEACADIFDGSQEADDMDRVIKEADRIIQQAETIKVLAKERAKHPDVKTVVIE